MLAENLNLVAQITLVQPTLNERDSLNQDQLYGELVPLFEAFSPDLRSNSLAQRYVRSLIKLMVDSGTKTKGEAVSIGSREFYNISRNLLGPLHVEYVHTVLSSAKPGESLLFAARDATPFYWIAETLMNHSPHKYEDGIKIVHADWNRWFMGQEDELDDGRKPIPFNDPTLIRFYRQMGFGTDRLVKIVEPGAWGSAANAIKRNMPNQPFELWFLFSHMPEYIYGFLNEHTRGIPLQVFEMINDTGEALPKQYLRPDTLIEKDGKIVADLDRKIIPNGCVQMWAKAAISGSISAVHDFLEKPRINIQDHTLFLMELAQKAYVSQQWTGMLPENTQTWSQGQAWKSSWPHGKILPLK